VSAWTITFGPGLPESGTVTYTTPVLPFLQGAMSGGDISMG
jgi:hypothetical protein